MQHWDHLWSPIALAEEINHLLAANDDDNNDNNNSKFYIRIDTVTVSTEYTLYRDSSTTL